MRMRIGLVVSGGFDPSGRERVTPTLLWLVERLARRHEVHVFVLHYYADPCSYPLLGATVHDIGRVEGLPGLRRGRQRRRLAAAIEARGRFDVLHAYQGVPAVVTAPVGTRLGVPVVVTFDSGELTSIDDIAYGLQRRWLDRRLVSAAIQSAARVTVPTAFMARRMPDGSSRGPAEIVPIGVDAGCFPPIARTEGPPWRLLRVGSINAVKDHETLLRAFEHVVAGGLDAHLDIVGEDTVHGRAQALCRAMQLDARVTFHGFQPTERLAAIYARAHLHLLSSRHESAGAVVLEAAAAGVPTAGTAVGYVADWQPDRAVAVPVQDAEALGDAVIGLLRDPAKRQRLAANARGWTLEHDADWTANQFERIYAEVRRSG
jgi:glycosyltransferase involved in cell wall biosynthesis